MQSSPATLLPSPDSESLFTSSLGFVSRLQAFLHPQQVVGRSSLVALNIAACYSSVPPHERRAVTSCGTLQAIYMFSFSTYHSIRLFSTLLYAAVYIRPLTVAVM